MPLIPLTEDDLELILPWRNAPEVRHNMYTHHEISLDEHRTWFERMRQDPSARWYLYRDAAGEPRGVVYFTAIDLVQKTAFWGFYASPEAKPGTGTHMEYEALDLAFGELALRKLNCEVLASNPAVVNLHRKVGFTQEGVFRAQHFDGAAQIDIIRLGLLANEWVEYRERLRQRVTQLDALATLRNATPPRKILILSDADSWINGELMDLIMDWGEQGHAIQWAHGTAMAASLYDQDSDADFCFCLSLGQIVPADFRARFRHTLVVHASDLPKGRGWSPLTWQIIEGQNRIPVTLFEAAERVDSGAIYAQRWIEYQGHELIDELRAALAVATLDLCRWFVDSYPVSAEQARPQQGEESFYPRRRPGDSQLDATKPLAEQFDLLRVVDNQRYPAFFECRGHRYRLSITRF